ncbi:hypothetical protein MANES_06G158050v8 [Manihot esculenta]|uniref:Uncharacterized protein n=1 Tax=Manihot esculenta TaxID=3983 RepID=A0ACB7HK46_MANES|nr:hypothetical protein MANES_06G158050v8 [Manihot esculenta]
MFRETRFSSPASAIKSPSSSLCERSRMDNLFRAEIWVGIVPVSAFQLKFKEDKELGRVPRRVLLLKFSICSSLQLPISTGSVPPIWFSDKSRKLRFFRSPISFGISPLILLLTSRRRIRET